jgi:hypothetical protein
MKLKASWGRRYLHTRKRIEIRFCYYGSDALAGPDNATNFW